MTEKRFTTVELPMPTIWGIWYDGAYLSTNKICILLNEYVDVRKENEQLKKEKEELSVMKLKGLKVLEFYEDKLKNADRKEFENAREELWIVKEVLCEMGVIKDE